MHISNSDTKISIGGFQARVGRGGGGGGGGSVHSLVEKQFKRQKFRGHSFICTLQCILLSCDTTCDSAVFHMTAHDIYANSAHDPLGE